MALSDGSSDEDPVDSARVAVDRVDVPANVDELASKLTNLTCSTAPATKIKVAEIDIADTMGPIGTLTDESGTSYADFDGQDDHTGQKPQKDFFLQNSCRAREFPLTDQLGDNEVAVGTGRRDAQTIPTDLEHAVSSPDCGEESTVGSPSSIKANRAVHFSTDLPGDQPTVHVLNQSTEAVDRIYWAFSSQPPTVPIDVDGPPADWPQSATFSSLPDLAETERGLADLPGTPVHTYLSVDFTDEQLCPVWDVSLAMGPLSGQTLIDSGASRHSLGRLGMKCAQNVRRIDPLIMNTANGQVTLSLVGDVVLKDGTLVRDWLINKWSETNLLSEGLANADKSTNSLMITSPDPSLPKLITTATTRTSAMRIGVLDFLPPELDIVSELSGTGVLANCTSEANSAKSTQDLTNVTSGVPMWKSTSEVLANCTSEHPKTFPETSPIFPEFLDIPDTIMGSEPTPVRGSDLLNQYCTRTSSAATDWRMNPSQTMRRPGTTPRCAAALFARQLLHKDSVLTRVVCTRNLGLKQ